jgi:hypothetical protein
MEKVMKTRAVFVIVAGCLTAGPLGAQVLPTPQTAQPSVQSVPLPAQAAPTQVMMPFPVAVNPATEQEIAMLRMRVAELEKRLAALERNLGRPSAETKPDPKAPRYTVGQIIVVGNEHTPSEVVTRQLGFFPGGTVTEDDLRHAEQRLTRMNIFEFNPQTGVRPTISILANANPNAPVDILVHVHER